MLGKAGRSLLGENLMKQYRLLKKHRTNRACYDQEGEINLSPVKAILLSSQRKIDTRANLRDPRDSPVIAMFQSANSFQPYTTVATLTTITSLESYV